MAKNFPNLMKYLSLLILNLITSVNPRQDEYKEKHI